MTKIIDLTGQKFGQLTVLGIAGRNRFNQIKWSCICECGKQCTPTSYSLKNSHTTTCGHERLKNAIQARQLPKGESGLNRVYARYKLWAERRNLVFELTKDDFRALTTKKCYYCGSNPCFKSLDVKGHGSYLRNGIDRMDNSLGYSVSNCVPCCPKCNSMKSSLSIGDFLEHCGKIVEYSKHDLQPF